MNKTTIKQGETKKAQSTGIFVLLSALTGLVACGGGGGGGSSTTSNTPTNQAPSVTLADDFSEIVAEQVVITAAASDSDGDITRYSWEQQSGPEVNLVNADTASVSFIAPAPNGEDIVLSISVTDNDGDSASDSIAVDILPIFTDNYQLSSQTAIASHPSNRFAFPIGICESKSYDEDGAVTEHVVIDGTGADGSCFTDDDIQDPESYTSTVQANNDEVRLRQYTTTNACAIDTLNPVNYSYIINSEIYNSCDLSSTPDTTLDFPIEFTSEGATTASNVTLLLNDVLSWKLELTYEDDIRTFVQKTWLGTTLEPYLYHTYELDAGNNVTKEFEYTPGPDGLANTADDTLSAYTIYELTDGIRTSSITYGEPGPDGDWETVDDNLITRETEWTYFNNQ